MRLGELLKGLEHYQLTGDPQQAITEILYDSRKVIPGSLFVALRGYRLDGHDYLHDAVEKGAVALVAEEFKGLEAGVIKIVVPDSRRALSKMAVHFYHRPFGALNLIGITGTNGKTTTSYLLESILRAAGKRPGVLGTITNRFSDRVSPSQVTTPESLDLMRILREMADEGVTDVVMEVSSHALDQRRTEECPFRVGIFTNLSRDHLDYHKTMEDYFMAKSRLFRGLNRPGNTFEPIAVINMDDPRGAELKEMVQGKVVTYGLLGEGCHISADSVSATGNGLSARLRTPLGVRMLRSSLLGEHNVYNILAATGAAVALGITLNAVVRGIEDVRSVPGRLEPVQNLMGLSLIVDYAHTPDALEKAIKALRSHTKGRVITLFGCGGDRDKGKRYEMGLLAGKMSDLVFLTSDNPRSENPLSILLEIERGVKESGMKKGEFPLNALRPSLPGYFIETDRRKAITMAVGIAEKEDTVLIAGKGHENYQIIGTEKKHFDDREVVASVLGETIK